MEFAPAQVESILNLWRMMRMMILKCKINIDSKDKIHYLRYIYEGRSKNPSCPICGSSGWLNEP